MSPHGSERTTAESLREYGRGVAGGLLFSVPLLYTMEVWWTGFTVHSETMIAYLLMTFVLLLGYNRYAGMHHDATFQEVAIDSIEEMGIGLVVAATVLYLLGRIDFQMPVSEIVGKIVIEAMTVAIGVSVGTAQLGGGDGNSDRDDEEGASGDDGPGRNSQAEKHRIAGNLVLATCGAILFASNVAPTEEVRLIAVETPVWKLLCLAAFSILMAALTLFYIEFVKADPLAPGGRRWTVVSQLSVTYAIALLASALMLWFFQRFNGTSLGVGLAQTVVLAFPGVLGASAGKLLIR